MLAALGHNAQEPQRLECCLGTLLRCITVGGRVVETLAGAVHGGPESVIVGVVLHPLAEVARML